MPTYHHIYGDLLTAKEVSLITGFTMNQLRNWRTDARAHLAPFGSILLGATSFYRQVVVQDWLDENGTQNGVYRMTERDKKFPIAVSQAGDVARRLGLDTLAGINSETAHAWREKIAQTYGNGEFMAFMDKYAVPIYTSEYPDYAPDKYAITTMNRFTYPVWFAGAVKASRMLINDKQNLGFTEAEIEAIPIGQYPPANEAKRV